jgi:outer membrane receptor protein involved in Fe transport
VAVAFNGSPLIRNRLFEQEYFDVERVEVLRGPQGTLYGRNATAGVINVISAKPTGTFEGAIKGEVGNYQSRRGSAFINIPILGDTLAVRIAGAFTDRDGYDFNSGTQNPVNGRNLWSTRLSIGFRPNERLNGVFVWEHFNEDDNRSRTGKQLCHRDPGPTSVGAVELDIIGQANLSQGCKPGSLYDDSAFGTPNGMSLPFVLYNVTNPPGSSPLCAIGRDPAGDTPTEGSWKCALQLKDPYAGATQSRDLRVIDSFKDPRYRAKTDVLELNASLDLTDMLTLSSQTAYVKDELYSFQDYNRFNSAPIFTDTSGLLEIFEDTPSRYHDLAPGGVFCDPQLGCSNKLAGFDISQAKSTQFSQEFRLQSAFDGPLNFSVGANYLRYKTFEDYYVMYNLITLTAMADFPFNQSTDVTTCLRGAEMLEVGSPGAETCIYIDPNPLESIDGEGHNYYRSANPYHVTSWAGFGESYWQVSPNFKVTAGLRYTDDRKTFTPIPTQVLLTSAGFTGGEVSRGYPRLPDIKQHWGEFSGRLGVDWSPDLAFSDQTMIYAFYSRGYKGGGANPPGIGYSTAPDCDPFGDGSFTIPGHCIESLTTYPATFDPEFVDAFEIGSKNTLLGGAMTLNVGAFFYQYKDYQVSQIKERTAVNENFDAEVWGLEFESLFRPTPDTRFNASLGYQGSRIADGEKSIDLMDRTQGHEDWILAKPFVTVSSNCVAPRDLVEHIAQFTKDIIGYVGNSILGVCSAGVVSTTTDPITGEVIDRSTWPNGGAGFDADLSGNTLPNAPHWTISLGAQHSWNFSEGWQATVRADGYWQSQSWARVYNDDPYDKLHGWYNVNLSVWFERPDDNLKIELYAKNLLDKTPITDAFLNSDDSALTTNVFVLDPRLIGLSIHKVF